MTAGVCQYCGCTDEQACDGGCSWADKTGTLCSVCELAEQIAEAFYEAFTAIEARRRPARAFLDLPLKTRQPFVIAGRLVLEKVRQEFMAQIGAEATVAALDLGRLAQFLHARYPEAMQDPDKLIVDVALELLGEKRIVLAGG